MVDISGSTHIGKRNNNEDNFAIGENFAVVADGMGGHSKGEVASKMAVECISEKLKPLTTISNKNILDAVDFANIEIYDKAQEDDFMQDMGTTVVMCTWHDDKVIVANVGDSRCYLVSDNNIKQITVDHSYVQSLIDIGKISATEAEFHPDKNVILRAVGCESSVKTDLFTFSVSSGDVVVLCSDGLSGVLSEGDIKNITDSFDDAESMVQALVDKAYESGGSDNITAVVVIFQ